MIAKMIFSASLLVIGLSNSVHAESGIALYEEHCASCHGGEEMGPDRVAPPVFAVKGHYLNHYEDKESFVKAIVAWVKKPEINRAHMPGAIRRFDLMPAIDISQEHSEKIAEFIYDGQFQRPGWYAEHYRQEHGEDPK